MDRDTFTRILGPLGDILSFRKYDAGGWTVLLAARTTAAAVCIESPALISGAMADGNEIVGEGAAAAAGTEDQAAAVALHFEFAGERPECPPHMLLKSQCACTCRLSVSQTATGCQRTLGTAATHRSARPISTLVCNSASCVLALFPVLTCPTVGNRAKEWTVLQYWDVLRIAILETASTALDGAQYTYSCMHRSIFGTVCVAYVGAVDPHVSR